MRDIQVCIPAGDVPRCREVIDTSCIRIRIDMSWTAPFSIECMTLEGLRRMLCELRLRLPIRTDRRTLQACILREEWAVL